jgi:uncharacterized membrane protein YfcA
MDSEIALFAAIGFLAQLVDGALGMAFGVIASTSLIAFGAPPAVASAAIHAAEVVTTGVSGASHLWHRNVDRRLFLGLAIAGSAGGILGAYVLTGLPEHIIKPLVSLYLLGMAFLIFARVFGYFPGRWKPSVTPLGFCGGFLDAVGGGGWGPLVASTLIATGDEPRRSIGSVSVAEFFITMSISVAFLTQLDLASYGKVVLGLVIGGALAAPLAGYLIRVLPARIALILVGLVVGTLSLLSLVNLLA